MIVAPDWHYIVKDNFFDQSTYQLLMHRFRQLEEKLDIPKKEQMQVVYSNTIKTRLQQFPEPSNGGNSVVKNVQHDPDVVKILQEKVVDTLLHVKKFYETEIYRTYSYLSEEPIPFENLDYIYQLIICGREYVYPWHTDSSTKVISVVVYMNETNNGTELSQTHLKEKHNEEWQVQESEKVLWKPNRALIFCGTPSRLHNYSSNHLTNRNTIVMNLLQR
jgi:hypothetical protein